MIILSSKVTSIIFEANNFVFVYIGIHYARFRRQQPASNKGGKGNLCLQLTLWPPLHFIDNLGR
jgi:hypothetical protein